MNIFNIFQGKILRDGSSGLQIKFLKCLLCFAKLYSASSYLLTLLLTLANAENYQILKNKIFPNFHRYNILIFNENINFKSLLIKKILVLLNLYFFNWGVFFCLIFSGIFCIKKIIRGTKLNSGQIRTSLSTKTCWNWRQDLTLDWIRSSRQHPCEWICLCYKASTGMCLF